MDPMLTDPDDWHTVDFQLYADLLQVRPDQVLKHKRRLMGEREEYFNEVAHKGDLFVDPNTGIALRTRGNIENYIKIKEIHQLLGERFSRILCVYQHISREKTKDRVGKIIAVLKESDSKSYCCSYETSIVAMLFISKKKNRIEQMHKYFRNYLGRHADRRVQIW